MRRSGAAVAASALALALAAGAGAQTGAWTAQLSQPDSGEFRTPSEAIVLELPPLPAEVLQRLAFELDGYDVTASATVAPGRAELVPAVPLAEGAHELRLYEWTPDGQLAERGAWTFEVRKFRWIPQANLDLQVSVEVERRLADHRLKNPPERTQVRGYLDVTGDLGGDNWSVDAYVPIIYDREADFAPNGRSWDLADFLLEGRYGSFTAKAGHHAPEPNSLIMEGFHRRGVSLSWDAPYLQTRLTGFAMRTEPITGFDEGFGVTDHNRRVNGGSIQIRPFEHSRAVLDVAATYLRGSGEELGTGVSGVSSLTQINSGTAWDGWANLGLFSGLVNLRAEYAETRFDFDGDAGPEKSRRDNAKSFEVTLRPWLDRSVLGQAMTTELKVEYRVVGPDFKSVANPYNPVDRKLLSAYWSFDWAGLGLNASFARERDNVDNDDSLPRFRNDNFAVDAIYRPPALQWGEPTGWKRWVGALEVGGGWSRNRIKPVHTPDLPAAAGSVFFGLPAPIYSDEIDRSGYGSLGSSYGSWGWRVSHTIRRFTDNTDPDVRTRSDDTAADVWIQVGSRANATARLQRSRIKDLDTALQDVSWLGGVSTQVVIIPERLDGSVSYDFSRSRSTDGNVDNRTSTVSAYLNWHALIPRERRPGLTFTLSGSGQDFKTPGRNSRTTWQVFLKATLSWGLVL